MAGMEEGEMKINRTGVTRIVFLTKRYAIKVPRWNYGWEKFIAGVYSNLSEVSCWNACKGHCSSYLCPILFSFAGFIVVMPRIEICKTEEEIACIPDEDGEDRKPDNYGHLDDRIVCVDYPYHRINAFYKINK